MFHQLNCVIAFVCCQAIIWIVACVLVVNPIFLWKCQIWNITNSHHNGTQHPGFWFTNYFTNNSTSISKKLYVFFKPNGIIPVWCQFGSRMTKISLIYIYITRGQWVNLHAHEKRIAVWHYNDVIMTMVASQITSLTVVYSTVYSDADQRKHQSSVSLAFVRGIHRYRWIPRTKGQLRGKCFHLMTSSWTKTCRKYYAEKASMLWMLWQRDCFFITLRQRQNGCHFPDYIFKGIFFNENALISNKLSLKFVPKGSVNNIPALAQIMAWCQSDDNPLFDPMMA